MRSRMLPGNSISLLSSNPCNISRIYVDLWTVSAKKVILLPF